MYRKIRITVVSLVIIVVCALSSTTTLSYFTDTDAKINDFTIGSISTVLAIYDDVTGDGKRPLDVNRYPLTTGEQNDIPFYLQATNSGNVSVYQRFRVVIPIALASMVTLDLSDMDDCVVETAPDYTCSNADYIATYNSSVDNTYAEYYVVSKNVLGVGRTTSEWPTTSIHIDGNFVADDSGFACENDSNNCVLGIRAYSDAIQTAGFVDAVTAFENLTETY